MCQRYDVCNELVRGALVYSLIYTYTGKALTLTYIQMLENQNTTANIADGVQR